MVTTAEATSRAYQRFIDEHGAAEFADVHPILVHTHGPGVLHVRGAGVTRLEDMAGLTLRGPTRIVTGLLGDLGATAIGMPVPAVPEALSKGVIGGVAIPWEVSLPLKIAELVYSHTEFDDDRGLYTATFLMAMNRDAYAALPDDLRAVIDAHSGVEAAAAFGRAADALDRQGRAAAEARGNPIHRLDAAETARWRAAAAPTLDRWVAEMAARGLDGAALHAQAQALIDEETAN
jgi:TRAP-type C4-dicarboxylate transport system substrate-binding protein